MASLQRIRNHGGLLIAIVGLAMLAFILGDLLNNSGSLLHRNQTNFGSVAGNQVTIMDFQNTQQFFNSNEQFRSQNSNLLAWNTFVTYFTYKSHADQIGMTISADEFNMASAMLRIPYGTPSHITEGQWLQAKYLTLMQNGLAANKVEAKFAFDSRQKGVSAEYVLLPYDEIEAQVSEGDLEAMYNKHKAEFRTEPYRSLIYYVINFEPREADYIAVAEEMSSLREEFASAEDIEDLINSYDNDTTYRDIQTYTAETVPAIFKDFAFGANAQVGACSELIQTDQAYEMARIMGINKAKKTADLAIIKRAVTPSQITESDIDNECKHFLNDHATIEEFEQAARENGWVAQYAMVGELSQNINNIADTRKVVTWAFGVGKDAVSQQTFVCDNKVIVLAAVVETDNNGYAPLENAQVYGRVASLARKEAAAAVIAEQMPSAKSLDEVAAKYNKGIQSVARVMLADNMFGGNAEPAVVGAALAQKAEITPIAGNRGIYFVKAGAAINTNEQSTDEIIAAEKATISQSLPGYIDYTYRYIERETPKSIYDLSGL